jgi:MerR family copper efflux transcriptional regulator
VAPVPIVCSLTSDDKSFRGAEWRHFLETCVTEVVRSDTLARLRLIDGDDVILAATDLARREKDCCAFFDFRLDLLSDEVWLEVEAPLEAAALLDDLISSRAD